MSRFHGIAAAKLLILAAINVTSRQFTENSGEAYNLRPMKAIIFEIRMLVADVLMFMAAIIVPKGKRDWEDDEVPIDAELADARRRVHQGDRMAPYR